MGNEFRIKNRVLTHLQIKSGSTELKNFSAQFRIIEFSIMKDSVSGEFNTTALLLINDKYKIPLILFRFFKNILFCVFLFRDIL